MNVPSVAEKIREKIYGATDPESMQAVIYSNDNPLPARHEFLFFIKPEITLRDDHIRLEPILNLMFQKLKEFGFDVKEVRILYASYLEKYNIIAQHYGVINAISKNALQSLTPEGIANFKAAFGREPDVADTLGSLEFLDIYKNYDPFTLDGLWQNSKAVKLAGGTYCVKVSVENKLVYLLNGFHPKQLVHFTKKGRSIVALNIASDVDWSVARNLFIGKTNPQNAEPGSLRFELLKNREAFGLDEVNASLNGFHLSAGPVEGLVELMRYCSDFSTGAIRKPVDFQFGRQLSALFPDDEVIRICSNHYLNNKGTKITSFDLTEEKNSDTALKLLKESELI